MAPRRSERPESAYPRRCSCAKLLEEYDQSLVPWFLKSQVQTGGYFLQLHEKAWTFEICYDIELQIGNPREHQHHFKHPIVFSPFVVCIGFIGPRGEDETSCIEKLLGYVRHSFADLKNKKAKSGIMVTRDARSMHIRMACMPQCCTVCGKCKHCRAQLFAVNILVESLGIMTKKIRLRQIGPRDTDTVPHPRTELKVLKELLVRLFCGFQREGVHHQDVAVPDLSLLHLTRDGCKLLASTYESFPSTGFVYDVVTQSLECRGSMKSDLKCGICFESCDNSILLRLPCRCLMCIECLARCFDSALESRASFPPKCCGKVLGVHQHIRYLPPTTIDRYIAVADEYKMSDLFYCANKACSAFIRSTFVEDITAMCPKCLEQTCVKCRKLEKEHWKKILRECPVEQEEMIFKALADDENWKSCPRCLAVVERIDGCNHVKCRCGQNLCYQCGDPYENEPECRCGLGVEYENQDGDEDDRSEDDEGRSDDDDEGIEEDEEDAAQREALIEAGIPLVWGDIARIRAEEIRLREENEERDARRRDEEERRRATAQRLRDEVDAQQLLQRVRAIRAAYDTAQPLTGADAATSVQAAVQSALQPKSPAAPAQLHLTTRILEAAVMPETVQFLRGLDVLFPDNSIQTQNLAQDSENMPPDTPVQSGKLAQDGDSMPPDDSIQTRNLAPDNDGTLPAGWTAVPLVPLPASGVAFDQDEILRSVNAREQEIMAQIFGS